MDVTTGREGVAKPGTAAIEATHVNHKTWCPIAFGNEPGRQATGAGLVPAPDNTLLEQPLYQLLGSLL